MGSLRIYEHKINKSCGTSRSNFVILVYYMLCIERDMFIKINLIIIDFS